MRNIRSDPFVPRFETMLPNISNSLPLPIKQLGIYIESSCCKNLQRCSLF